MDVLSSLPLQFGAFTLLAAFIIGFIIIQRERDNKAWERQGKSDEFIHGLVNEAMKNQAEQRQAWQEMTAQMIAAHRDVATALSNIAKDTGSYCTKIEEHDRRAQERHNKLESRMEKLERQR